MRFGDWMLQNKHRIGFEFENPFLCSAEPDGDGDGGGDGDGDGGEQKPDFTKLFTDFSTKMEGTLGKLQKELGEVKKSHGGSSESVKALQAKLDAMEEKLNKPPVVDDDDKDKARRPSREQAEIQAELDKLKKANEKVQQELEAANQRASTAETKRRNSLRDSSLQSELAKQDAVDPLKMTPLFRDKTTWDEDSESWLWQDGDNLITIEAGLKKELDASPWMVKAKAVAGGSGGQGGRGRGESSKTKLMEDAVALGVAAGRSGGRDGVSLYTQALNKAKEGGVDVNSIKTEVKKKLSSAA